MLKKYIKINEKLVKKFVNTYFSDEDGYEADYYIIGWWDRMHWWPVEIADTYWNIDDMYTALLHNIPEKILMNWYWYSYNKASLNKNWEDNIIKNLYSFYKSWDIYTNEEEKEDDKKVNKAFKELLGAINK